MHPLVPLGLALLCVDASPQQHRAPATFLVLALASVTWRAVSNLVLLALFVAQLVDTAGRLQSGTAPAIVFAASAPLDAAFLGTELALLRNVVWAVRAVALVGAVAETLFTPRSLLVTANNVVSMALATWTPAEVTVSYLVLSTVLPGTLYLSVTRRGNVATVGRLLVLWGLFKALASHRHGYELSIAMAAAISL